MQPDASTRGLGGFLSKAARVATGHAAGYGVGIVVSPLLARMYGPEAFGFFAAYVLAVSSLGVLATLRFDQAITLAKSVRSATVITQLATVAMLSLSLLLVAAAPPIEQAGADFFGVRLPSLWSVVLASGVVCLTAYQLAAAWLLREARYRDLATMRVVFAVSMATTQLAIPTLGGSILLGLPAGQAVGFAMGTLYGALRMRPRAPRLLGLSTTVCRRFVWRYRQFAMFGVPAALVSNMGIHSPALILAGCYGWEVAGLFAFAQRVFTTPLTLLTHSFSRVFLAEATRKKSPDELASLFRSTLRGGAMLAAMPIATAALVAPWCFGLVFGNDWAPAGWICTVLAPMALAMSLAQIVSPVYDLVGRQDRRLIRELACTAMCAGGMIAAWLAGWSALAAICMASVGGTIGYVLLVAIAAHCIQQSCSPSASTPTVPRLAA